MDKSKRLYFYVYAVVNFEQKLAYIGSRGSEIPPIEDAYMGSYSRDSDFWPTKKIILSEHKNRTEAFEAEREWQIKFDVAKSPLFVNKGIVHCNGFSAFGRIMPEEEKIRRKLLNTKPVSLKDMETGEILRFDSQSLAAEFIGCSVKNVNNLVKGRSKSLRNYTLPETSVEATGVNALKRSVVLKWIKTGEIIEFNSVGDAAKFAKCDYTGISKLLSGVILSSGGFTLPDQDISGVGSNRIKRRIQIQNIRTGKILEFSSYTEASKFLGCWKTGVHKLANKQIKSLKGYRLASGADL